MPQPTPYTRSYSFSDYQEQYPQDPLPGPELDINLDSIQLSIGEIISRLALIQRDDGNLQNLIVGYEALSNTVKSLLGSSGINVRGAWLTATSYAIKDMVTQGGNTYVCVTAHTSGTFNTDLAANKWQLWAGSGTNAFLTANNLSEGTPATMRTNLGLVIGTDVLAYDAGVQSIAGLTTAADKMIYTTAPDVYATATLTSVARSLLDDTTASAMRTTLGVIIGTDVQAYDATLAALAGLATGSNKIPYSTGVDTFGQLDFSTNTALGSSDTTIPSQKAVKDYVDGQASPGCSLYQTTGTVLTITTWVTLLFDTEAYEDSGFTHSTVSNTGRITVGFTGRVNLIGTVDFGAAGNAIYALRLLKNGSAIKYGDNNNATGGLANIVKQMVADLACINGDYFELQAYTNAASPTSGTGVVATSFTARRIK